jgi:hypothetical protein
MGTVTDERATLRLEIGGEWSALEFAGFFETVQRLYAVAVDPYRAAEENPDAATWLSADPLHDPWAKLANRDPLAVVRVVYESPGVTDFAGIGAAVTAVKELVLGLLDARGAKAYRDAVTQGQQIDNARSFVQLLAEAHAAGLTPVETENLMAIVKPLERELRHHIRAGRIRDAEVLDS